MSIRIPATIGSLALAAAVLAVAPQAGAQQDSEQNATWVDIKTWNTDSLYKGWSANSLLDEEVYSQYGDEMGEIEDIIVGPDGRIQHVIVEGGAFLDIGDTHAAVPWSEVTRVGTSSLKLQVAEGSLDDYGRFPNMDDVPAEPKNFRIREVIGDFVTADGTGYGTVDDVIFSQDGKMQSVIVSPAYGYGYGARPVALPYNADTYDPSGPYYEVPYGTAQLEELKPFNYGEFE